jgi:hypothetical protein
MAVFLRFSHQVSSAMKSITVKTVASLLHDVDETETIEALDRLYDENASQEYRGVIRLLKEMAPDPTAMNCHLRRVWSSDSPPESYVDVSGIRMGDPTYWAIEFRPWPEWLGMAVTSDPELELTDVEALAHVLYEITWGGWTPEGSAEKFEELLEGAEEAIATLEPDEDPTD